MIHCKELNKEFSTKSEMIKELIERMPDVMAIKKSVVKFTDPNPLAIIGKSEATKGLEAPESLKVGDYVYPVINTTNYLDSHTDVHLKGIWNKSIKEQKNKVFLVADHDLSVKSVIAFPKDVEIFTKDMKWSDLGANMEGETEALIFKTRLTPSGLNQAVDAYINGETVEHSVRMINDKMFVCISPEEEEHEEYNANWAKYYPEIVNKERADELGYFFAIKEARIFKEGSMVLAGSNDITPTLYNIDKSPEGTNQKDEPSNDTQDILKELFNFKL